MISFAVHHEQGRTATRPQSVGSRPSPSVDALPARLRTRTAIQAVFARGRRAHARSMELRALSRGDQWPARTTVVAGRRLGGAVTRNRAKRRLRAVVARHGVMPPGVDVVVIARSGSLTSPFESLVADFAHLLDRALGRGP